MADGSVGEVSLDELMNIGNIIRKRDILTISTDELGRTKRVYEKTIDSVTYKVAIGEGENLERTITFYSHRNLQGTRASATNYYNPANSESIVLKLEPKGKMTDSLTRIKEIEQ